MHKHQVFEVQYRPQVTSPPLAVCLWVICKKSLLAYEHHDGYVQKQIMRHTSNCNARVHVAQAIISTLFRLQSPLQVFSYKDAIFSPLLSHALWLLC